MEVDLTYDESAITLWEGIARGFVVLVDRTGLADQLRITLASWQHPVFEATAFDQGTWPWLLWLVGRWQHGQYWMVRYGLMDTLTNRVLPLLDASGLGAEQVLEPRDLRQLYQAAPRSADPDELARSLRATAELYDAALDCWAARTGQPRPVHPLAPGVLELVRMAIIRPTGD